MRIIVILSPTNKRGTKMDYTKLRKFLIADGYLRIAEDVFMRVTTNRKGAEKHLRRLEEYAPKSGCVRVFKMTEKQYENIWMLAGGADYQERVVGKNGHVML